MALALLLASVMFTKAEELGQDWDGKIASCEQCQPGFVGGIDLTVFRLHAKSGAGGNSAANNFDDYFPDYGFLGQGRYWVGYEIPGACGIRTRFFQWEAAEEYLGLVRETDIEMYDIEGMLDLSVGKWDLNGFAGLRWGSTELDGSDFGEPNPYNFEGAGLTAGFEFRRCVWGGLSIIGGARYSVLYGDTGFLPVSGAELDNTTVDITELRVGVEWARETRLGGRFFVSAAWEHQGYGTDTYFPFAIDPETLGDVSLAGPVFSIGLDR
jgi:hypothetical protein